MSESGDAPIITGSRRGDAVTVLCEECGEPVRGDGYVWIDNDLVKEHEDAVRAWHARLDTQGSLVNGADFILDHPKPVRWRAHHRSCDPVPDANAYTIEVAQLATYRDLVSWSAHLIGKGWLEATNWARVLRVAADQQPSLRPLP